MVAVVVEEVEVEVVVEEAEDYHLGRTDRKQLNIHRQGSNSIVLVVEEAEEVDIQGMDY